MFGRTTTTIWEVQPQMRTFPGVAEYEEILAVVAAGAIEAHGFEVVSSKAKQVRATWMAPEGYEIQGWSVTVIVKGDMVSYDWQSLDHDLVRGLLDLGFKTRAIGLTSVNTSFSLGLLPLAGITAGIVAVVAVTHKRR